ncbi:glutathione S-transferase [Bisgaardia hudsonensis]|uniref:Glutathione S-transferase n=1 Tax=Bisgaardia hudsonensis TaxID=109472 RepID=A0A4R2MYJ0_9PAST|nr:glutathione S-transferase N-terminal domain-containing protein [Bisgaardia hudsonensis]QLB12118.1 glutathione S-transferase [Bisgaardia hudsonensis]TCP11476.1 glutathione S-transferase [Bisgaardia hudsonensis]
MKLWYSTTSPFVRKTTAIAHYHHLQDKIELLKTSRSFDANSPHNKDNPLGKIPALQLDNGDWLYNSSTIAEYLDSIGSAPSLFNKNESYWKVQSLYALSEGILENLTSLMLPERMLRPKEEWWNARHTQIIERTDRTLNVIAEKLKYFGTELNIGTLYTVCMIDFLVFRSNVTSAEKYSVLPKLKEWSEKMNTLYPCLSETKPYIA